MFNEYKDILTPADVAKALGIGKNTVYKLIEEHAIRSRRIGRKIIIPKVCLIDYAQSQDIQLSNRNGRQINAVKERSSP